MKHSSLKSLLKTYVSSWVPGSNVQLIGFQVDFFISLYKACSFPVVLVYPDNAFDDVVQYCSIILDKKGVLCVPPRRPPVNTPSGFLSKHKQEEDLSLSMFAAGLDSISFVLCAESSLSKKIVSSAVDGLRLSSGVCFDDCVNFFQKENYLLVDVVTGPDEFALRGGIIDIFPNTSIGPIRISFLEESVSVHSFNINTQITNALIYDLFIPSKQNKLLFSINEALQPSFVFLFYNVLGVFSYYKSFNINDICKPIKYSAFIKRDPHRANCIVDKNLSALGLIFSDEKFILPPWFLDKEMMVKRKPPLKEAPALNVSSINSGDFVVHRNHGVGVYLGLGPADSGGEQEFLSIKYKDGGIILVDSVHLDLVHYYAASDAEGVVLDSLNKKSVWKRRYNSAAKNAQETVSKLVTLYVNRGSTNKTPLSNSGKLEDSFISAFPYVETEDQACAWKEISEDLTRNNPMDRLLCGDVGFGKTELAMRAAFRCVLGKKRVIVLAPTTILANQLYKSFNNRLGEYAVNVGVVSRLCTKQNINQVLDKIINNNNDVLIGTHSILNNDIYLKNIGLLIVDEEHRFGVAHKEKIKSYKNNIDVLSMSATPIPRSMNLASSGIYSISLLQTPPLMRLPIITSVNYYDPLLIKQAVLYEINSGGQVFFIHNNVKNIDLTVESLSRLLPELKIISLHGQESSIAIKKKMALFSAKKVHILVCTSIIEAGIDVPTANCIIINNAHQFGLSQLYQMRGRVGRSNKQAYAYMIIPKNIKLSNKAYSRIKAIEKNSHLGAGYNIAHSDMNIRGSGHLFGYKQSGSGGSVGYELYMKLIQKSLHGLDCLGSGFSILPEDVLIKIDTNRYIPEKYIAHEGIRLSFYKAISSASNKEDVAGVCNNMQNRFGPPPLAVNNLIKESLLKLSAAKSGVSSIIKRGCGIVCEINNNNGFIIFPSFIEIVESFFRKKHISFHVLPKSESIILICIHILDYKDKYSILSKFLDKFQTPKQ